MAYLPGQASALAPNGTWTAETIDSTGQLNVSLSPTTLFYDNFDTALDMTNNWTSQGTAPTLSSGLLVMGATVSTSGSLVTQPTFSVKASQYLNPAWVVAFSASAITGASRFFGMGKLAGSPAIDSLASSAAGFQLDSTGVLQAVTYNAAGVKTVISALTRPTDGLNHRYSLFYRNSKTYWYIDGVEVASATYLNTGVQDLPVVISYFNTGTITNALASFNAVGVADENRLASQISDGNFPWRKATVSSAGSLGVNIASSQGTIAPVAQALSAAVANNPGVATTTSTTAQAIANVSTAGNSTFHIVATAFVGTLVFEASLDNGLNYAPVMAIREDGTGAETSTTINVGAAFIRSYTVGIPGFTHFRVRCSAFTSGTAAAYITQGPFLIETNPSLAASTAVIGSLAPAVVTATNSTVTATAATFVILNANVLRKGATIYNDSVNTLYLAFAATASATAYNVQVPAAAYYELPGYITTYTGIIAGFTGVATGTMRIAEFA